MPLKLTDRHVANLGTGEHWDALIPGFGLRVGTNRRTWLIRYRAGGRNPRVTIGHYPAMSLSAARDAARAAFQRVDQGGVPSAPAPHPRSPDSLTVAGLLDRYEQARRRDGQRIKSLTRSMKLLRKELADKLALPAAMLSKADVRAIRDAMTERGASQLAGVFLRTLSPALRWAAMEDIVESNVCDAVRKVPARKRSRVLTRDEIARIWRAAEGFTTHPLEPYGRLIRFLLVTGLRKDEGASIRYGDILDGKLRIADTKTGRPHALRLPKLALDLLGRGPASQLAFGGGRGGKLSTFARFKPRLDEASGVSDWVLHDLRRSMASHSQEIGIEPHVIELILNHAVPGIRGVYQRSEMEDAKADALARWATELERLVIKTRVSTA